MFKKLSSLLLCITMIFTLSTSSVADFTKPSKLDSAVSASVRDDDGIIRFRWQHPRSVYDLIDQLNGEGLYYLVDWKKNNGEWNVTPNPDSTEFIDEIHGFFMGHAGNILVDDELSSETFFVPWHFDRNLDASSSFDFSKDTYYFRIRYLLTPYSDEFEPLYSSYSDTVAIGKDASVTEVTKLDAPQDLKVQVLKDTNGKPYFKLDWIIPTSVSDANKSLPVFHCIDFKIGNGKWYSEQTNLDELPVAPSKLLTSTDTFDPVELDLVDAVVIEENTYHFRILFECEPTGKPPIYSSFSNIASTKVEAYSNASEWAKGELNKADEYGLIPESLRGKDLTKPITREEFAELAVVLYETTTGKKASPVAENPFPDTTNPEILKAYNLQIVAGYSTGKFGPKDLINREQVASMLHRAIKVMIPDADFSTAGAPTFKDDNKISSWALTSVKYIAKQGIILGSNGNFMPKATTNAEIASGYATTTREQAILMGVRTYEKYK